MKLIFNQKNKYILRCDKGEEIIAQLKNFCQKRKISAGVFWGIGAVSNRAFVV